jgi:hypothetical protein
MNARVKRVTVRAYNLRPGDILVSNPDYVVDSAVCYPGTWNEAFVDVAYTNGKRQNGAYPDAMITVTRNV